MLAARLSPVGHNWLFRSPLATDKGTSLAWDRSWGKSGSQWGRAPDVVPIAVTHGLVCGGCGAGYYRAGGWLKWCLGFFELLVECSGLQSVFVIAVAIRLFLV